MSIGDGEAPFRPECAAASLRFEVDQAQNAGAIAEASDATDRLQEPGAEPQEYDEKYVGARRAIFEPLTLSCLMCNGNVSLGILGDVTSENCLVSGSCEQFWANAYPENYIGEDGEPVAKMLPCVGGACKAVIALDVADGKLVTNLIGVCAIKIEGAKWGAGLKMLESADIVNPDDGIERFDGEGLSEEEF